MTARVADSGSEHQYLIFSVTALALLMASVDGTIVNVGIPTLLRDLHTNLALIGWTLTGYQLTQTIIMPLAGKLSDDWGRKRLFLGAVVVFTISSMLAGIAPNIYFLIVFRVLQALGGGAFLPSATGIISDAFGARRGSAIGLFTSIFPIGGIIGPNIGGFLLDHTSWHWIFYVNVPIGITLLVLGLLVLPNSRPVHSGRSVDVLGAAFFASAMLGVLYAMTDLANSTTGTPDLMMWLSFAIGGAMLVAFLRHEARTASPMIELELLRWRPFLAANLYNFIYGAAVFGLFSFIPYYATTAYSMSAGADGAILTPRSIAMMLMSTFSSLLLIRYGYRKPMIAGPAIVATSLLLLSRGIHNGALGGIAISDFWLLAALVAVSGLGVGIEGPASNNAALDLMPEKIAAVAGLRGMFRSTGGLLGTALMVLYLSHQANKAIGMQHAFVALAVVSIAVIPLVFLIPERGSVRGRPLAAQGELERAIERDEALVNIE